MADGDNIKLIAETLRNIINNPDWDRQFWQGSPDEPFTLGAERGFGAVGPVSMGARQLQLVRDLFVFRSAVRVLRGWGQKTMPGIFFRNGSLPSSPQNSRLVLSNDPVSAALREAWSAHREQRATAFQRSTEEGSVIEMPLEESTNVFSNGMAVALTAAAASGTTGIIHFTVNSQNDHYRVHVTEQYWYSPVVFGSKLSTPVDDLLYPANYRFGGNKGGQTIRWDSGIHAASASHTSTIVTGF